MAIRKVCSLDWHVLLRRYDFWPSGFSKKRHLDCRRWESDPLGQKSPELSFGSSDQTRSSRAVQTDRYYILMFNPRSKAASRVCTRTIRSLFSLYIHSKVLRTIKVRSCTSIRHHAGPIPCGNQFADPIQRSSQKRRYLGNPRENQGSITRVCGAP